MKKERVSIVNKIGVLLLLIALTISAETTKKAKNFTAQTVKGKKFELNANIGEGPILINFWATWCVPCAAEMEAMKPIYAKYKDKGLKVLSISADDAKSVGKVNSVVRSRKYPYTILLDPSKKIYNAYHLSDIPQSFLIDKTGNVVFEHKGFKAGDEKELEKKIEELIN